MAMPQNTDKGFLQTILIIVIALLVLSYFHITWHDVVNAVVNAFHNFFK